MNSDKLRDTGINLLELYSNRSYHFSAMFRDCDGNHIVAFLRGKECYYVRLDHMTFEFETIDDVIHLLAPYIDTVEQTGIRFKGE